jgi:hypothetical protein
MGIVLLKRFFGRDMADIHYALHNIVLPYFQYPSP